MAAIGANSIPRRGHGLSLGLLRAALHAGGQRAATARVAPPAITHPD
ncbi:MAG: hypothetical protein ACK55I_31860 [bacterium]